MKENEGNLSKIKKQTNKNLHDQPLPDIFFSYEFKKQSNVA